MIYRERTNAFAKPEGLVSRPLPVLSVRWAFCSLIQLYRLTLSPAQAALFGGHSGCRFTPTCSQYAMDAIREHGVLRGSLMALKRICRCHPFGGCGHDPVPLALPPVERHSRTQA